MVDYTLKIIDYQNNTKVLLPNAYNINYRDIFGDLDELSFNLTFYQFDGYGDIVKDSSGNEIENYAKQFVQNENIIELKYNNDTKYFLIKEVDTLRNNTNEKILTVSCLEKSNELAYKSIPILDLSPSAYNPTRVDATISHILSAKFSIDDGNVVSVTVDTITLSASASTTNDIYNGMYISILDGSGQGQTFRIVDYVGSTKVATLDSSIVETIDTTSVYSVYNFTWRVGNVDDVFLTNGGADIKKYYKFTNNTITECLIKVAERMNGYLSYRYEYDDVYNEFVNYVDLVKPNEYNSIEIRYSKNLISSQKTSESESQIYTRLFVYGDAGLSLSGYQTTTRTDSGVTYNEHTSGQDYIENYQHYLNLGYDIDFCRKNFINDKHITDELYITAEDLYNFAHDKLEEESLPKLTYQISYIDLKDVYDYDYEEFRSGDTVRVYDEEIGLDFYTTVVEKPTRLDIIEESKLVLQNSIDDIGTYFNKVIDMIGNI